jgi:hypothetical protein
MGTAERVKEGGSETREIRVLEDFAYAVLLVID